MIITEVKRQKKDNRLNIYIDNEFAFGIEEELAYKYGLIKGKEINNDLLEIILGEENLNKVINSALHYLSYRQRSEKEVFDKLRKMDYDEDNIQLAINYCKSKNYIDDSAFASSFIRDKKNLNKYGPIKIKYELIRKGISQDIISEVLSIDGDEEYSLAMELATKKIVSYRNDDNNGKYRKLGGFLQRKGYSYDIVKRVLKELIGWLYALCIYIRM